MTVGEAAGTTYDGATPILTAQTPVTPGDHSVYFSIFDAGDRIYDSAVFLDGLSLGASGEGGCQAGVVVSRSLNVQTVGDGSGNVSDGEGGQIDCSGSESDCSGSYPDGTEVTLTATPNEGSVFAGWGDDDCATATGDTCTLTMDGDKNVTAVFDPIPVNVPGAPTLNQALAGNHEVGLNWSAPDSNGGSPITKYTVYANPCPPSNGAGPCIVLDNVSPNPNCGSTFNYVIGGLTNGTPYSFTVRASNANGPGPCRTRCPLRRTGPPTPTRSRRTAAARSIRALPAGPIRATPAARRTPHRSTARTSWPGTPWSIRRTPEP